MWNAATGAVHRGFFLSRDGLLNDLGSLPGGSEVSPGGFNELGVVVGSASVGSAIHAFRWQNRKMIDLNLPLGPNNNAASINNRNQIVGWMGVFDVPPFVAFPFLWQNGVTTQLPLPSGAITGSARTINNKGEITGRHYRPNPSGSGNVSRGLLWRDGEVIEIQPLPSFSNSGSPSINDHSQMIGSCWNVGSSALPGFLWRNGVTYPIDQLLPPHPTITNIQVASINNNSEIVGTATLVGSGTTIGVVLLPIPPLIGDVNCDQKVNVPDLLTVIHSWGRCAPPAFGVNCPADLDSDSNVGLNDLLTVVLNWAP